MCNPSFDPALSTTDRRGSGFLSTIPFGLVSGFIYSWAPPGPAPGKRVIVRLRAAATETSYDIVSIWLHAAKVNLRALMREVRRSDRVRQEVSRTRWDVSEKFPGCPIIFAAMQVM